MKKVLRLKSKTQIFFNSMLVNRVGVPKGDYLIKGDEVFLLGYGFKLYAILVICGKNAEVVEIPDTLEEFFRRNMDLSKYDKLLPRVAYSDLVRFVKDVNSGIEELGIEL